MADDDIKDDEAPKVEATLVPAGESYVVRVAVKDIPAEIKTFGPFDKEEAEQLGADIQDGDVLLNFALLPDSIEAIFVELEEAPEEKAN